MMKPITPSHNSILKFFFDVKDVNKKSLVIMHYMKYILKLEYIWIILIFLNYCASDDAQQKGCLELGFKETVLCSSCDDLAQFVHDDGIALAYS
jgi:hypothetical protein